jgi:hypothetical protein
LTAEEQATLEAKLLSHVNSVVGLFGSTNRKGRSLSSSRPVTIGLSDRVSRLCLVERR